MKKILILGGSGFLGSHLADTLNDNNYNVTIYDQNRPNKLLNKKIKFVQGSILDYKKISTHIKNQDYIYHYAGLSDLNEGLNKSIESLKLNVESTVNILDLCRKYKIKKFIYSSSIYVLSQNGGFYKCSKQAAEIYIKEFFNRYKLKYNILRFGSVYGTRSGKNNSIHEIIKSAIKKRKIEYVGDSRSMREYINVKDAAKGAMRILDKKYDNKVLNLTGPNQVKVSDALMTIKECLGIKSKINFKNKKYLGHYILTPYHYNPEKSEKLTLDSYIDFGEGILEVIDELDTI
tara:strand:+ start:231 stop:1100 length:870 start_codon:yes stop_codon:yes gene_type:complete